MFIKEKPEKIWETAALKNGLGIRMVDSSQGAQQKEEAPVPQYRGTLSGKDSGGKNRRQLRSVMIQVVERRKDRLSTGGRTI